ncbi:MAG: hypothetical protein B7C54_06165 [Acidimicrobiales bacterium mtb01]|nr:hypothetical protein [Actinomycetota bacterium]TEX46773.1 MAG: hypothetical protein B7C54_06165 [Acidimicrobiales bacterium mtb01]
MKRLVRAMGVLAILGVAALVVANRFGTPDPSDWSSVPGSIRHSLREVAGGRIDAALIWQWCGWILWICWAWVFVTFASGLVRRGGLRWTPGARLAAFVLSAAVPVATVLAPARPAVVMQVDSSAAVTDASSHQGARDALSTFGVGSALIGAGVYWRVRSRREQLLRSGGDVDDPVMLETIDDSDAHLVARIDLGVRHLVLQGRSPSYLVVTPHRDVVAEFESSPKPTQVWAVHGSRSLVLPADTPLRDMGESDSIQPPLLLHVGTTAAGQVWVNLDVKNEFVVDERGEGGVWSAVVNGVALSPFTSRLGLVSNVDNVAVFGRRVFRTSSAAQTLDVARRIGESVAVADGPDDRELNDGDLVIRRGAPNDRVPGLSFDDGRWRLMPFGVDIRPVGSGGDEIEKIRRLLGDPLPVIETVPLDDEPVVLSSDWSFMASILGSPEVVHVSGRRVDFERAKAEELVIWLSLHPEQRKRSLARTALWNAPVKDATFSNMTADARRALSAIEATDDPWLGITMTDDLPLHPRVTNDLAILRDCFEKARRYPEENGLDVLRYGLEFVRGTPFATSSYLWPDNVGVATEAAVLVVRAALLMAEMCQQIGDVAGVYWATAKGLLAIPGHDELVAIRMRTHADLGDMSAVRAEWDAYCRLLAADDWSGAEPSPKLLELWRRLNGLGASR